MFAYFRTEKLVILLVIACALGMASATGGQTGDNDKKKSPPYPIQPLQIAAGDDDLQKLLKARFNKRLAVLTATTSDNPPRFRENEQKRVESLRELTRATLELDVSAKEKLALLKLILEQVEYLEAWMKIPTNSVFPADVHRASAAVIEVQIEIHKLKKAMPKEAK